MKETIFILFVVVICVGCQNHSSEQLQKAASQAQASLTNFIAAVQSPTTNQFGFAVMTALTSTRTHESRLEWVTIRRYDNGVFYGAASGDPSFGLKQNQPLKVYTTNVCDWVYFEFGKGIHEVGNFTGKKHG